MDLDILKLIVVLTAFLYLHIKVKPHISPINYWIINVGLLLLLFASVLDSADGFRSLNHIPIIGRQAPFHDVLEDQFGDIPGFALFALGAFREIMRGKNKAGV